MKTFRLLPLTLAIGTALALPAQAQSLLDLYDTARGYDATYQSAKAQYDANLYKADQAKASLLPTVGLTASATNTALNVESPTVSNRSFDNQSTSVSLTQPLYRPSNLATYEQGKRQADIAEAQLRAAEHQQHCRCLAQRDQEHVERRPGRLGAKVGQ